MRGERGNEEERDFTHRLVTTGQLVTIEFLAESNFCVTTPLSFVSRFIPMEETTFLITLRPQASWPVPVIEQPRGMSPRNDKQPRSKGHEESPREMKKEI